MDMRSPTESPTPPLNRIHSNISGWWDGSLPVRTRHCAPVNVNTNCKWHLSNISDAHSAWWGAQVNMQTSIFTEHILIRHITSPYTMILVYMCNLTTHPYYEHWIFWSLSRIRLGLNLEESWNETGWKITYVWHLSPRLPPRNHRFLHSFHRRSYKHTHQAELLENY